MIGDTSTLVHGLLCRVVDAVILTAMHMAPSEGKDGSVLEQVLSRAPQPILSTYLAGENSMKLARSS